MPGLSSATQKVNATKGKKIAEKDLRMSYDSAYDKMKEIVDNVEDQEDTDYINSDETDQRVRDKTGQQYTEMMEGTDDPTVRKAYHDAYMDEVGDSYDYDPGFPAYKKPQGIASMQAVEDFSLGGEGPASAGNLAQLQTKALQSQLAALLAQAGDLTPSQAPTPQVPFASLPEVLKGEGGVAPDGQAIKMPDTSPQIKGAWDKYQDFNAITGPMGEAGLINYDGRFKANEAGVTDFWSGLDYALGGAKEGATDGFKEGLVGGAMSWGVKGGNMGLDMLNASPKVTNQLKGTLPKGSAGGILAGGLTIYQVVSDPSGWWQSNVGDNIVGKFSDSAKLFEQSDEVKALSQKALGEKHKTLGLGLDVESGALFMDGIARILEGVKGTLELLSNVCFAIAVILLVVSIVMSIFTAGAGAFLTPVIEALFNVGTWLSTAADVVGMVSRVFASLATAMHLVSMALVSGDPEAVQLVADNLKNDMQNLTKEYVKTKTTQAVDQGPKAIHDKAKGKKKGSGGDDVEADGSQTPGGGNQNAGGQPQPKGPGVIASGLGILKTEFFTMTGLGNADNFFSPQSKNLWNTNAGPGHFTELNKSRVATWDNTKQNYKQFMSKENYVYLKKKTVVPLGDKDVAPTTKKAIDDAQNNQATTSKNKGSKQSKKKPASTWSWKQWGRNFKSTLANRFNTAGKKIDQEIYSRANGKNLPATTKQELSKLPKADQDILLNQYKNEVKAIQQHAYQSMNESEINMVKSVKTTVQSKNGQPWQDFDQEPLLKQAEEHCLKVETKSLNDLAAIDKNFEMRVKNYVFKSETSQGAGLAGDDLIKILWTPEPTPAGTWEAGLVDLDDLGLDEDVEDQLEELNGDETKTKATPKKGKDEKEPDFDAFQQFGDVQKSQAELLMLLVQQKGAVMTSRWSATEATHQMVSCTHKSNVEAFGNAMWEHDNARNFARQKQLLGIQTRNDAILAYRKSENKNANLDELKAAVENTKQATDAQRQDLQERKAQVKEGQTENSNVHSKAGEGMGPFEKFLVDLIMKFVGGGATDKLNSDEAKDDADGGEKSQESAKSVDALAENESAMKTMAADSTKVTDKGIADVGQEQVATDTKLNETEAARVETETLLQGDKNENLQHQIEVVQGILRADKFIEESKADESVQESAYLADVGGLSAEAAMIEADSQNAAMAINNAADQMIYENELMSELGALRQQESVLLAGPVAPLKEVYEPLQEQETGVFNQMGLNPVA